MIKLYRLAVVDRFEPPTAVGSSPYHYVLDVLGARILAAERGVEFRELGWRKEQVEAFPWRHEFRHLLGTNGFFTRLIHACRTYDVCSLAEWWNEERCRRFFGDLCRPDGYGRLEGPEGACSFLLEFDRGTESPSRLSGKLVIYDEIALVEDSPDALLFCFPNSEREISARKRLYSPNGMILATTSWDRFSADPLGDVWLPSGSERRVPLLHLQAQRDPR